MSRWLHRSLNCYICFCDFFLNERLFALHQGFLTNNTIFRRQTAIDSAHQRDTVLVLHSLGDKNSTFLLFPRGWPIISSVIWQKLPSNQSVRGCTHAFHLIHPLVFNLRASGSVVLKVKEQCFFLPLPLSLNPENLGV